jgi:hypothetical protein
VSKQAESKKKKPHLKVKKINKRKKSFLKKYIYFIDIKNYFKKNEK